MRESTKNRLGRFNPIRTFGLLLYILGGVLAVPWAVGAVLAPEFMLKGSLLLTGIVLWIITLIGVAGMRIGNAQERRRQVAVD